MRPPPPSPLLRIDPPDPPRTHQGREAVILTRVYFPAQLVAVNISSRLAGRISCTTYSASTIIVDAGYVFPSQSLELLVDRWRRSRKGADNVSKGGRTR